jgi:hypothetical protein
VLIPPDLDVRLQKAAQRQRLSRGAWVRRAIELSLDREMPGTGENALARLAWKLPPPICAPCWRKSNRGLFQLRGLNSGIREADQFVPALDSDYGCPATGKPTARWFIRHASCMRPGAAWVYQATLYSIQRGILEKAAYLLLNQTRVGISGHKIVM